MNEGVKILIDRMESNPEDFETNFGDLSRAEIHRGRFASVGAALRERMNGEKDKWEHRKLLTEEELTALDEAYLKLARKRFTENIMAKLLAEPEKREEYAYDTGTVSAGFFKNTNSPLVINTMASNTGPQLHLDPKNITTINEMIEAWRKHD